MVQRIQPEHIAVDAIAIEGLATGGTVHSVPVAQGDGTLKMELVSAGQVDSIVQEVLKASPGTILKGQAIYVVGFDVPGNVPTVELAKADAPGTMPSAGTADTTITDSVKGNIVVHGEVSGIDTSMWGVGDDLYVSEAVAGGMKNTKPTGATNLIQKIAQVLKSDAGSGVIEVFGAGRVNDIPNLANGNIWKGDGVGVPQSVAFDHAGAHAGVGGDPVDHDTTANYDVAQHREINDAGTSTIETWSASKTDTEISTLASGLDLKAGVDTTTFGLGDITLSGEQTLNGVSTSSSRVLVVEQAAPEDNGIYITSGSGWSRAPDADGSPSNEVSNGNMLHVLDSGSTDYKSKYILVTADPITVGVTGQDWERHRDIDFGTTSGTATEGNDTRVPSHDENNALVGTSGTPSTSNPYVTNADPRNSDARTPVQATESVVGGGEIATQGEIDTGTDDQRLVTPLKLATTPRLPTQPENDALVGTAGAPSSSNKYVTDQDVRLVGPAPFWKLNGRPVVAVNVDGAWVAPRDYTITRVTLYRRIAGTSGSTTVDVNIDGTTIFTTQANRPSVAFGDGPDAISVRTNMDVTALLQDSRLQMDIDVAEGGNPQDVSVIVELVPV